MLHPMRSGEEFTYGLRDGGGEGENWYLESVLDFMI